VFWGGRDLSAVLAADDWKFEVFELFWLGRISKYAGNTHNLDIASSMVMVAVRMSEEERCRVRMSSLVGIDDFRQLDRATLCLLFENR